jgi:hypothetical protein
MDLEGFSSTILSDTRNTDIENAGDAGNLLFKQKHWNCRMVQKSAVHHKEQEMLGISGLKQKIQ